MGSVKDLVVLKNPKNERTGVGRFVFSDRYSVFDYGKMPDEIEDKGKSLCIVSAYFFEKIEEIGIKTHYIGVVEDGKVKKINDLKNSTNIMEITLLRVLKPEVKEGIYDYSIYKKERCNFLIPLEIIYRNALPEGSSIFKRIKEGKLSLKDIGLEKMPEKGEVLKTPIIDVSTKYEDTDRYITFDEAKKLLNLKEEEIEEIKKISLLINSLITEEVKRIGLFNEDGKFEFGFDQDRNIILVDTIGTLDECRFTYKNIPVSKEIARIYYRNSSWFKEVEEAKKAHRINWRKYVKVPPNLPFELKKLIEDIYKAFANEITQREWFKVKPLKEILEILKEYIEKIF